MAGPAHSRRLFFLAAGLLLAGATVLRFSQIDRRLLHADEGVQAYQTWQLLRGQGYTYDPGDKHGPFLYYAAAGLARISGWSPATLNATRLRTVTALAGLGTLVLLLGSAARLGRTPALIGAAVLAAAPLAVIYDTYFVQEAWFCFFTWALFFAALRLRENPTLAAALLVGGLAGLMQATKETSVLHFAALAAALLAIRPRRPSRTTAAGGTRPDGFAPGGPDERRPRTGLHLLVALLAATFTYLLFYSAFFTRGAGVADGLRTYFSYAMRATDGVHEQPWYYYAGLLWPHSLEGVRWGEPLLLALALVGAAAAFSARATPTHRAVAVFTLTLLFLYAVIPYKMPWLLLTPYAGLALLAGFGAAQPEHWLPAKPARYFPAFLALALLVECGWLDRSALGRYASDDRNPYLYQPTAPDLGRLLTDLAARPAGQKLAVVSPDHAWPLPWYLRDRPATGYFTAPPAGLASFDLVLLDSRLDSPSPRSATAFGLRPDVVLWRWSR